jgi:hypothetical protein
VVWRRVKLVDSLSIADLHHVIQLLIGWDDITSVASAPMAVITASANSAARSSSRMQRRCRCHRLGSTSERFLYEYDLAAGWQIEVRVEQVIPAAPDANHLPCPDDARQGSRRAPVIRLR